MISLFVLRHAPTDWNETGRIQGRADRPLSEAGRARVSRWSVPASAAAAACCASSPLRRAMETASLLAMTPEPEPRLVEMDWGEWEGRRLADLRAELGAAMAENEAAGLDFRPPGGESPRDVQERLKPFIALLAGPTVAVTHKGVLRALYALAAGWDMRGKPRHKLADAHAHRFDVDGDGRVTIGELNIPLETPR